MTNDKVIILDLKKHLEVNIVHGNELFERESDGAGLAVVDVKALAVPAPIAVAVGAVALADLHPALGAPAVVAEEVAQAAEQDNATYLLKFILR
jgi:hypothetical protein